MALCPLNLLAILAVLVHIYGQHEHHSLLQPETHLNRSTPSPRSMR
jgi:DNA repair ATPase RecN